MKIIDVAPIASNITKDTLSYFTSKDIDEGSIVIVPIRNRMMPGVVIETKPVSENKEDIKNAEFQIKKIEKVEPIAFISKAHLKATKKTAEFFCCSIGSVINTFVPSAVLKEIEFFSKPKNENSESPTPVLKHNEKMIFQATREERMASYKSLIREEFAKGSSILLCLPTIESAKQTFEVLQKGIEKYAFLLHSSLSKKDIVSLWQKVQEETHPVVVVCTPVFLTIARDDWGTIIVDEESSGAYKTFSRPYIDARFFAEELASALKIRLILGDLLIRIETLHRFFEHKLVEYNPVKWRLAHDRNTEIIDTKDPKNFRSDDEHIISTELWNMIDDAKEKKKNLFIYSLRRGLGTQTLCADCGSIVVCTKCNAPIVLHKSKDNTLNFFLCHHCGEKRSAEERCKNCTSWRLQAFGIGSEGVYEELRNKIPPEKLFQVDGDNTPSEKKIRTIIAKFYETPGGVLIGTDVAMQYLSEPISCTAITSVDSLFSIPDFRINEKIMGFIAKIKSLTEERLLIQTRQPEQRVLEHIKNGSLIDFYREELAQREKFGYPPFKHLIKISIEGTDAAIRKENASIEELFQEYNPQTFPAFIKTSRGKTIAHTLIKADTNNWPDEKLRSLLLSLPQNMTIKVDPENLL
ncbi:MAG: primosomal protein N' [Candidatus Paceibacterota bacterium]